MFARYREGNEIFGLHLTEEGADLFCNTHDFRTADAAMGQMMTSADDEQKAKKVFDTVMMCKHADPTGLYKRQMDVEIVAELAKIMFCSKLVAMMSRSVAMAAQRYKPEEDDAAIEALHHVLFNDGKRFFTCLDEQKAFLPMQVLLRSHREKNTEKEENAEKSEKKETVDN